MSILSNPGIDHASFSDKSLNPVFTDKSICYGYFYEYHGLTFDMYVLCLHFELLKLLQQKKTKLVFLVVALWKTQAG